MSHDPTISATESALLVVDAQTRLAPAIAGQERILRRIALLLDAAAALGVPVLASEQAPESLGPTVEALRARLPAEAVLAKTHFSCLRDAGFAARWQALGRRQAVVCGMEAHVCVAQTALDLAARGVQTFVVADAVGSRNDDNRQTALHRFGLAGLVPVPAESVVFEWLGDSGQPAFRDLIRRIKDEGSS
jgi:nicotinamidase-related amidase